MTIKVHKDDSSSAHCQTSLYRLADIIVHSRLNTRLSIAFLVATGDGGSLCFGHAIMRWITLSTSME